MPAMPTISSLESLNELRGQLENLLKGLHPLGEPVEIPTRAGKCKALLYRPDVDGPVSVPFNDTDEASIAAANEAVDLMLWELQRHLDLGD